MTDQLISFETAILAKEKGFNISCSTYFRENKSTTTNSCMRLGMEGIKYYAKPTQSLLQKWLREVHNIHINITKLYECSKEPAIFEGWSIYIAGRTFETNYPINKDLLTKVFKTYKEALEKGLIEALKLLP
jgi:hypothetical protein